MLLSNGSLGCCPPLSWSPPLCLRSLRCIYAIWDGETVYPPQAWHTDRASKGPCPLSPPGLMKNRQVDITKIKSLLQKRQTSLCPGHEWLAIVVQRFHWNEFVLAMATSTFQQSNSARNGSDRASDWSYQESTSCLMWKKSFLFLKLLLWKNSH